LKATSHAEPVYKFGKNARRARKGKKVIFCQTYRVVQSHLALQASAPYGDTSDLCAILCICSMLNFKLSVAMHYIFIITYKYKIYTTKEV